MIVLLVACVGGDGKETASGADDTGVAASPDVAPVVESVDNVSCTGTESAGDVWQAALTVSDPQGDDTIASGSMRVLGADGSALADYALACDDGACSGSFRDSYDGIGCSMAGSISLSFVVVDEDGNRSQAKVYETAAR